MLTFSYSAKRDPQRVEQGTIEAETLDAAIARIRQMGYSLLDIHVLQGKKHFFLEKARKNYFFPEQKISAATITLFTRQASDLLDAGIPILKVLNILLRRTRHPQLKKVIEQLCDFVKDGGSLSEGLAKHPETFPKFYVNMVRSGELGGILGVVLGRLASLMEKDQETRTQVHTSLIYPSIILGVASISIAILFTWVVPKISAIFEDLAQNLPWPTIMVLGISNFLRNFWWLLVGLIGGGIFYFHRMQASESGKWWIDQKKLAIPFFGNFIKTAEIARFARNLGTLLENGVIIVSALDSVWLLLDNEVFKQEIKKISQAVANGSSLTAALAGQTFFSEEAVSLIAVGEESGQMHKGLYKLAEYYERQTQMTVKRITSLIEPVLILFLGLVVGFIFIGMLLPIFQMNLVVK